MSGLITNLRRGNLADKASSVRKNFLFTSLTEFNGMFLGTYQDGTLRKLGGADDSGVDIDAYIKTHKTDFNSSSNKRLRFVYLSIYTDGVIKITVSYSSILSRTYTITNASGMQILKIPIRRNEFGMWIDVKVENVAGADLIIREIEVLPVILSKGRNRSLAITNA